MGEPRSGSRAAEADEVEAAAEAAAAQGGGAQVACAACCGLFTRSDISAHPCPGVCPNAANPRKCVLFALPSKWNQWRKAHPDEASLVRQEKLEDQKKATAARKKKEKEEKKQKKPAAARSQQLQQQIVDYEQLQSSRAS